MKWHNVSELTFLNHVILEMFIKNGALFDDVTDQRSMTTLKFNGSSFSWKSKKQTIIVSRRAKDECQGTAHTVIKIKRLKWRRNLSSIKCTFLLWQRWISNCKCCETDWIMTKIRKKNNHPEHTIYVVRLESPHLYSRKATRKILMINNEDYNEDLTLSNLRSL